MPVPNVTYHHLDLSAARVFYRESVPASERGATVLLLHGFPSASHQFRRLIDALGDRHRMIALDYPGFGHTEVRPDFEFSFDRLADIVEEFCTALHLDRFVAYLFDFGGPVGMRVAERHPDWFAGLIVQNGNLYDEGLPPETREFIMLDRRDPASEPAVRQLMTLQGTRHQYETGAHEDLISPDGWTLDQHFLDLPGRLDAQLDLAFDYPSNVARYPVWQEWLRRHHPPTLVLWGVEDPFFPADGARAFTKDLPQAQVRLFDGGHFLLEDHLPQVAPLIDDFLNTAW
ncbi:alpha/beta fold hydrolase [Nocardioides astragali]|uniref:Alpha/beta fold hydrolase n=1 Tax=Nocardioides astragali TaxID=1776736 RepID=A0ABW2N7M0_9ACTN|nr:alpha/beta hydrolase [Nocardioides astragali]